MKENTDHMDQAIKDKFKGHEVPVPSNLWASIESNLPSEGGNNSGNFFFKKPFLFSILVISTIAIGTYIYNTKYTQNNRTTTALTTTVSTNNTDNSSAHSNNNTANEVINTSEKENHQTTNIASLNITENSSSVLSQRTNIQNTDVHKNNTASSTAYSKNIQAADKPSHTSNQIASKDPAASIVTSTNPVSERSRPTQTQAPTSEVTNEYVSSNANERSNISSAHPSAQTTNSDPSITDQHKKSTSGNDTGTPSADPLNNPSSTTNNIAIANSTVHKKTSGEQTNTLPLSPNTSENTIHTTVYADSIHQFASAYIQKDNHSNSEYTISNISVTNNTSTNETESDNNQNSDKVANLTISQIKNAAVSLNATNVISDAAEASALFASKSFTTQTNATASIDQAFESNTSMSSNAATNGSIDSINHKTGLKNTAYTNSDLNNSNTYTYSKNNVADEVVLKMDSTILAKEIESVTTENIARTPDEMSAQTTINQNKQKSLFLSRCSFDGYATPAIGYIHLSPNTSEASLNDAIKQRNKNAGTGFGITTGLRMNYSLTQKLEIGIGIQYSSLSQQSSLTQQRLDSTYLTYQGYNVIDSTYDSTSHRFIHHTRFVVTDTTSVNATSTLIRTYTDKFQNFSIPIHVAYGYSISNKFSLLARTSLLINYQTYSVTYLNASDSSIVGYHSNKNLSLGGSFSIGGYYQLSRSCSVFAEPIVYYYFSNLFNKQVPFKQTQLMLGLQTGIRFSF